MSRACEVALLLRDHTMVCDMAERILGNAVMYTIGCMETPRSTWASASSLTSAFTSSSSTRRCGGPSATCRRGPLQAPRPVHRAPPRRPVPARTADFLKSIGFGVDEELWAIDSTDCSPCDNKVPDSH